MRVLKVIAIGALVLALTTPSWALTFSEPYNGPIKFLTQASDSGTSYVGLAPGAPMLGQAVLDAGTAPWPGGALGISGPGAIGGEDSWGAIRVLQIQTAHIDSGPPPGVIDGIGPPPITLWNEGTSTTELIAIFWGETDTAASRDVSGTQTTYGRNLQFALWEQPKGTFVDLGSAGRSLVNPQVYAGIGTPGGVVGATLILTGTSTPGFLAATLDPLAEFTSVFNPNGILGNVTGGSSTYLSVNPVDADAGGVANDVGVMNSFFDTNFFVDAGPHADLYVELETQKHNVLNAPIGGSDWTVTSQSGSVTGEFVPEPVTMIGLLMSVMGVGGYLRRRRLAA